MTREAPRGRLDAARENGELPAGLDTEAAVELLFTTVLGPRVRGSAPGTTRRGRPVRQAIPATSRANAATSTATRR
ncbi:hypothetical protein [Streptomyces sp. MS19]|uniref:hypothetical protein n=1 Tax=Streptomyces sp. MS19 TaxID=3385972 RepID=UPI0039A310C3